MAHHASGGAVCRTSLISSFPTSCAHTQLQLTILASHDACQPPRKRSFVEREHGRNFLALVWHVALRSLGVCGVCVVANGVLVCNRCNCAHFSRVTL